MLPWRARKQSKPEGQQEPIVAGLGPICETIQCFLATLAKLEGKNGFLLNPYAPPSEMFEAINKLIEEHRAIYEYCLCERLGLGECVMGKSVGQA
jgi:hypothetical protein